MTLPRNLEAILAGARVKNPCELLNGGEKPKWFRCSTSGYWDDDVGARVLLPNAGTLALYAIQGSLELLDAQPEPEQSEPPEHDVACDSNFLDGACDCRPRIGGHGPAQWELDLDGEAERLWRAYQKRGLPIPGAR